MSGDEKKHPGRRPVDLVASSRFPETRDRAWAAVRKLRRFSVLDIEGETRIDVRTLRTYLVGLERAGYLRRLEPGNYGRLPKGEYPRAAWELVRDVGVEAPRVRKDGTAVRQGCAREQMWRTMKILGQFTVRDLVVRASTEECQVKLTDAKSYVFYLRQAGYLEMTLPKSQNALATYHFVRSRYTGPRPPMVQRIHQVFDPNLGRVVWSAGDKK